MAVEVSELSFEESVRLARERLAGAPVARADAGRSRLDAKVEHKVRSLLGGYERPRMTDVHRELVGFCRARGLAAPSRSTVYNAIDRVAPPKYAARDLPPQVQRTLHNVDGGVVPGHQVVFAAFNYGDTAAICFAAGMPWLCLHRALQMRGWRPKSRALLRAVAAYRGLRVAS
jgi:hypothetical protein